jgi:hypothetical protein
MAPVWSPYTVMSNSVDLHSRWQPLLNIVISFTFTYFDKKTTFINLLLKTHRTEPKLTLSKLFQTALPLSRWPLMLKIEISLIAHYYFYQVKMKLNLNCY